MTLRNLYYNYTGYPNYYAPGGNLNFQEVTEEGNPDLYNEQIGNQKGDNKFLTAMNSSGGGGWAAAIGPAATNATNALLDTEASTADRVAGALGISNLAKIWKADTAAGDANLKLAQQNLDNFNKTYIQDASSAWGGANAVKLNNQQTIAPISNSNLKNLSWKDFRGNMFAKGAAATLQGAAAGSVGGPWGALGGAIVGLAGSLFGGIGARKRAKAAYADYQAKLGTIMSAQNSAYKQAMTNQSLSNMQALANGNMSQRINDMANIRAYGGNLFDSGGSVIDPDPPSSFMSDAEKEREMAERARIARGIEENSITADMLAAAHQNTYYPDRLADTYPGWLPLIGGDRIGKLSENSAWWERILPYAGTVIDWDTALADPNWKNIVSAGVSTGLDFLPILRALKGVYTGAKTAYATSRGIGKSINLSRESRAAKRAAMDSYENAEKNLLLDQLNKRFDIGTSSAQKAVDRYYDVVNATKKGTSRLGGVSRGTATAAKNAAKTYLTNLATTDLLGGIATEGLQSGADLAAENGDFSYMDIRELIPGMDYTPNTILSNNGVHFTYNPSSRTWVSEESQNGKRIVVPAEEMEQNLKKGLGKIIKDTEYAMGGNFYPDGGDLTDEQQMVLADIQADPRILFTPKYSQWRDYIRRTSPDYLDRLYTSLPYEQQKDIYQNDREAWGALSNNAKGNFGSSKVRNESNEISPYVAGGLGATLAAPIAIEALGSYALPYTYNGVVSGLNAASDYVMGTRFGQAVAPYVSNLLKPAADATFAFEGAKNFASSEGFNKTWNHFANGEIANGITSGLGDAFDLLMVGQGKPLLDATKEAATAIKKGGKYVRKQITASSRAEKLLDELDERMIHTDRQLAALNDDRLKADRLKYKAKQFFTSPSANIPIPSYIDYQEKFYKRIKNLLENNKVDEAETLLSNVNSPYKITRLPNGEYGLPLYSETPYSEGFLLGEKKMYNPSTGQYDSYYLDPSGLPSNIDYLTGTGKKSVKMDGSSIPEDYRNTISKNIDYITNELYPGTSPFGSSVLASEGNLYTNPHDFEVYMPESMLGKYKTNEWNQISPDTYTFTHPKVGDIDFNILRETPEGFATGQRSWQLASRQHPDWYKQYADKRFEDIAKGVNRNPIEQDPLPWTPQELLENANPNVNTMTDALFANKNAKHRNRRLYYLNNAKIDDLKASINEYGNYVMGGNYKPSDVPLSAFNDPSTNSKILEKMGINGIDKSVTNDPERMKTLFEYSILHKQIYGRGVTESNIASQGWDAVGSWFPETTGGTVHGVGLNTVRGGNSGHGNVYSILQPKSIEGITDPFDAIKVLDESVGIKELSNSERQQIRDAINNLGIDIYLPKEFSLKDVLRGTSGKKGVKYQQLNKAIEKITNTSGITDESEYGTGIYTSLWDLPQSKSANIIFGDLDRPNNPELLNTRNNTNPLFGKFLDRRVTDKVEKAINDSKMNSGRIYDSQSTVDKMYDVSNERYNKIGSYRDLINDRRRNVATKLAKAQSNAETVKQVSLPVGIGGAVFGGIAALSNHTGRRRQIIDDAQKAGIDIRMKRGEETVDEYYDRLERELIQMGFYGQEALEEYNQYNNTGYAMGGNLYTDLSPNMMSLWNNKQQIDQQKVNMQQMNFGLGNSFNQKLNTFDYGGSMNGMDLPTGMQSYENGGTHEQNPYGGIQVGVDQQGNPNLVEEGEFRWGDYVFSDRINVDPTLLSRYNLAPATKHQGKKANKGKLSYADMAKKYAKKNGELANDPIGKNTLEAYMKRLQDAQEDQKFQDSMEQQKQDAINQYRNALTTPQQGNPMYGAMKYNGMGNAATQQGVNAGMSDLGQQGSGNEVLSNTNRSGNNMLHAFGGNLFWNGGTPQIKPKLLNVNPNLVLGDDYMNSWTANNAGTPRLFSSTTPMYTGENPEANFTAYQKRYPTLPSDAKGMQQLLVNEGFDIGNTGPNKDGVDGIWGNKSQAAWYDFLRAYNHRPNTMNQYDLIGSNNQPSTSNSQASYSGGLNLGVRDGDATTDANNLGDGQTSYGNAEGNTNIDRSNSTGNTNTGNTTTGTYATNAFKEDREGVPLYSTAGKFATFGKGLTPMLYDWMNKTNTKYAPNQRPANELVDMGNNSTFLRTADTIGGYRAPNLMDAERMNNAAQAQGLAALQSALSVGNGNRGFAAAQANQQMYNTGMGIGNNYATAQQANNEERYKTDAYNTAIDQFNANARNTSYQDNQRAEQVGQQMALSAKQAANDYLQKENWYADRTNRTAMDNRATNQAAWTDNALNYFITQAQENAERNRQNNDITKRYWSDKDGVMHYIGDSGLNGKIREYFRKNNIDNGTFTGDRLAAFNSIIQNNKAKDVANEKGELWSTVQGLMDDEIAARNKETADADKAKADELQEYRDQFDSELAQLQRYGSDKMYGDYWRNQADLDYYSGATGKFNRDEQSLSQLRNAITRLKGYNERYNKWTPQNVTAYGGRINNGNKSNKNGYYTYTY